MSKEEDYNVTYMEHSIRSVRNEVTSTRTYFLVKHHYRLVKRKKLEYEVYGTDRIWNKTIAIKTPFQAAVGSVNFFQF